ncbi:Nuclear-interacting partner of ALK, partial [Coemansia aciculifera]
MHTWLVQSPHLSPVKCARNGWVNIDCSTLKCSQCTAKLIAELPDDLTGSEEVRWIERLNQMLQSSHNANCPWKGHECSESIYSVPLATSQETVDDICRHAADILGFSDQLPATEHPLNSFQSSLLRDLRRKVIALRSEKNDSEAPPSDCNAASALVLALLGWRADTSMQRPTIKCELCFRSVGLWLFRGAAGRTNHSDLQTFNVVDEHRSFCYWAHGSVAMPERSESSSAPVNMASASAMPGWQKTIASILRAKTMSNANSNSSSDTSSDEASSGTDDGGSNGTDKDNTVEASQGDSAFKRLKPFNISAISAAAEAFGIPFSMSLLARATNKLALMTSTTELSLQQPISTTTSVDEHSGLDSLDDSLLAGAHSDWESDGPAR